MSGTPPPTAPPSPDIPYAGWVGCGMISQAIPFVDDGGMLSPLNWRFLYMVFDAINREHAEVYNKFVVVENQITDLQNQITDNLNTMNTEFANVETQISNLLTTTNSLQTQINTINSRLAAAGIP